MASSTFATDNMDDEPWMDTDGTPADGDDPTATAASNRSSNDQEEQEILVKWQMPGDGDARTAKKLLQQLLAQLMIYHPGRITLVDHKQREWIFNESDNEEKFMADCENISVQVHPVKNKQNQVSRWVAITRMLSTTNISDWKDNDHYYSMVTAASTYMFPHPFPYEEWDTTTIGFLKQIHTIHHPKEVIHAHLYDLIAKQNKNPPPFQLIPQRISTTDKTASTKAYTVQCLKDDASSLIHLLTHGPFREEINQIFVPFKYKSKQPELFTRCIRQQNDMYRRTWIIKLEGLTPEIMESIRPDITNLMGVSTVVPTKRLHDIGEWKILVDQSKCAYVHRQLSNKWHQIIQQVNQSLLEKAPSTFSSPCISSKRARDYQDNDSDEDSYGSLLTTATDVSIMTNDDVSLNELPNDHKFPSYASAAAQSTKSGTETQYSSPTASTYTEWQKREQKLEEQIKLQAAQIEQIQADLEAKILRSKDLEEKLAQAVELAHSRDVRHEEMLTKFETLMQSLQTMNHPQAQSFMNTVARDDTSQPTTPERDLPAPPPPFKRPNTNSSPNRNIYNIFRPQATRSAAKGTNATRLQSQRKSAAGATTQPMETDDDSRQPKPGAKTGQMQE